MDKKSLKEIIEIADYLDRLLKEKGYSDCKVDVDNGKISFTTFKTKRYSYKSLVDVYADTIEERNRINDYLVNLKSFNTLSKSANDLIIDLCDFVMKNGIDIKFGDDYEKSFEDFIKY